MAFPNFSQSLSNFSNALANRKQRREIKRQQEEAAAARRAASNARNNRGLVSTLGGIAGAAAANYFAPGSGAVGMGLGYQLGSTLAGGANSIVKPYNSQELTGMPYTQPSAFETINQVAPMAMNAYGTYQQQELTRQQNDYTTNLNNLLKIAELQDLAPAATTKMINQLNDSHTSKYKLEGDKPTYMLDFSVLGSPEEAGSPYNYRSGLKQQENNLASVVSTGDVQQVRDAYNALPESAKRTLPKTLEQYEREARAAGVALADKNLEKQFRIEDQDRQNLGQFTSLLAEVKDAQKLEQFKTEILPYFQENENFKRLQDVIAARVDLKTYELNTIPQLENAKKFLEESKALAASGTLSKEDFMTLAKNAQLDEANANNLWAITQAKSQSDRDAIFISKVSQIDKDNVDLLGQSVAKDPVVLRGLLDSYIDLYQPSPDKIDAARASIETAIKALPTNAFAPKMSVNVDEQKITLQQSQPTLPSSDTATGTGEMPYTITMGQDLNGTQYAGPQVQAPPAPVQESKIRLLNRGTSQPDPQARPPQAQTGGQENTTNTAAALDSLNIGNLEEAPLQGYLYNTPDTKAGDGELNVGNGSGYQRGVTEANLAAINQAFQGKNNRGGRLAYSGNSAASAGSQPASQGDGTITNLRGGRYTEGVQQLLERLDPIIQEKLRAAGGM